MSHQQRPGFESFLAKIIFQARMNFWGIQLNSEAKDLITNIGFKDCSASLKHCLLSTPKKTVCMHSGNLHGMADKFEGVNRGLGRSLSLFRQRGADGHVIKSRRRKFSTWARSRNFLCLNCSELVKMHLLWNFFRE